ncbi:MAG: hypothetical protein JWO00_192 [Candidatus Parcubacteria bacterium]|nr:hypothetical protein [Candidatus Parcubacteria bacterium]
MSDYYNPRRTKGLYDPEGAEPFRISRSKIDLFLNCPLCFYLDRKMGVARPPGFPFNLNSAVDTLLKKEFDIHRAAKSAHPLMEAFGLKDVVPYADSRMEAWRDALKRGVTFVHEPTNFNVTGGVDDVWINGKGELIVVDYKATSKESKVNLDSEWQIGYKRQMEVYQWLLRKNDLKVSDTGYFVYCNGKTDRKAFDAKLEFDVDIIPYKGDDSWVEKTLMDMRKCLEAPTPPKPASLCDYCNYRKAARDVQQEGKKK